MYMVKQGDMNKPNIITDFYYSLSVTDRCKIREKSLRIQKISTNQKLSIISNQRNANQSHDELGSYSH